MDDMVSKKAIASNDKQRAAFLSALDVVLNFGPNDPVTATAIAGLLNAIKVIKAEITADGFPVSVLAKAFPGNNGVSGVIKILDNAMKACESVSGVGAKAVSSEGPLRKQIEELKPAFKMMKVI